MKRCTRCKIEKDFVLFNQWKLGKDGRQTWCKACEIVYRQENTERRRAQAKLWIIKNPERARAINSAKIIKHRYGLTRHDLERMLKEQNNQCKICNQVTKLVIDHCHDTGKVRALLCNSCNFGLGNFKETINSLYSAIEYLKDFHSKKAVG